MVPSSISNMTSEAIRSLMFNTGRYAFVGSQKVFEDLQQWFQDVNEGVKKEGKGTADAIWTNRPKAPQLAILSGAVYVALSSARFLLVAGVQCFTLSLQIVALLLAAFAVGYTEHLNKSQREVDADNKSYEQFLRELIPVKDQLVALFQRSVDTRTDHVRAHAGGAPTCTPGQMVTVLRGNYQSSEKRVVERCTASMVKVKGIPNMIRITSTDQATDQAMDQAMDRPKENADLADVFVANIDEELQSMSAVPAKRTTGSPNVVSEQTDSPKKVALTRSAIEQKLRNILQQCEAIVRSHVSPDFMKKYYPPSASCTVYVKLVYDLLKRIVDAGKETWDTGVTGIKAVATRPATSTAKYSASNRTAKSAAQQERGGTRKTIARRRDKTMRKRKKKKTKYPDTETMIMGMDRNMKKGTSVSHLGSIASAYMRREHKKHPNLSLDDAVERVSQVLEKQRKIKHATQAEMEAYHDDNSIWTYRKGKRTRFRARSNKNIPQTRNYGTKETPYPTERAAKRGCKEGQECWHMAGNVLRRRIMPSS